MCGIAGIFSPDPADLDTIDRFTDLMRHRGPNDRGIVRLERAALGHRRLSIIDLSEAGRQPMTNEDGTVFLVCNGEIYNFLELRTELAGRGHIFRSGSDCEVLIHLYEERGDAFLEPVNGMFALALWDARRRRLIAAVDRFGKKPLYYAHDPAGERLALASELKSLLMLPWVDRTVSPTAVDRYLALRHVPAPHTIFEGAAKLAMGTLLVWEAGRPPVTRSYWQARPLEPIGVEEAVERFETLVTDAVRLRLQSDVPLGIYLSGGVDSAAVAGLARRLSEGERIAYTVGFDYAHDERERATRIARHLDFPCRQVTVGPEDFEHMARLAWHLDEPFGDLIALPAWLLAKAASRELTVVLTGDGADEIVNGYFHQKLMLLRDRLDGLLRLPAVAPAAAALVRTVPAGLLDHLFDYPDSLREWEKLKLANALSVSDSFAGFYEAVTSCFSPFDKAGLYTDAFAATAARAPLRSEIAAAMAAESGFSPLSRLSLVDIRYWIPFSVICRLDKLTMAHAVEARSPFLDWRVVEACLSFPNGAKLTRGANKVALRRLITKLYPPELWEKGKQAFYMPMLPQYRAAYLNWARTMVNRRTVEARGLFRWPWVATALERAEAGGMLASRQLTTLAMLEQWFQVFGG